MRAFFRRFCNKKQVLAILIAVIMLGSLVAFVIPSKDSVAEDKYPIMGPSNVSVGQLMNYYNSVTTYPLYYAWAGTDAPTLDSFCQMYIDECNAEGVRVEVAFCQAMNETSYLRYTGRVPIEAKNFAGIGAVDSDPGAWAAFGSVREGIRAHVQHLKAYASTDNLNNWCVDPRFNLVSRGCAPYIEDLSGKWASSPTYGNDIRYNYMSKLGTFNGFTTMYQGVEYNAVYDPNYYLNSYADLRAAFANDGYALVAHFVNCGMNEGRQACPWFNVQTYKNNYLDLRNAFGTDLRSYYIHFVNCGAREGRSGLYSTGDNGKVTCFNGVNYSSVYDYDYYTSHNPDVKAAFGNDDVATLRHFVDCGMNEGRQANSNFNIWGYKNRYLDLRRAFGNNLSQYYRHYVSCGRAEGRDASYTDRVFNGEHEFFGIDFSLVYDFNYYQEKNPDIRAAFKNDDVATFCHFLLCGMREGRQASAGFNIHTYANNYPDLFAAFFLDLPAYYLHYINCGFREGRIAV